MFERFTDAARRAVTLAQEEARGLNHDHIGSEHLLLGLLREGGTAARALASAGVSLEDVRERVEATVGRGTEPPPEHVPFAPNGKKVMELAMREALRLRHDHIGTEHLLLGVVGEGEGLGTRVLETLGVGAHQVRQQILELLHDAPQPKPRRRGLRGPLSASTGARAEGGVWAVEPPGQPLCHRCRSVLETSARWRTLDVPHDGEHPARPVTVVYCDACGATVGVVSD